ncbi:MAG TPA: glycoside hydrolase family 3 protein [Candidatus Saccharimonadales bacterium]|nr:glycoside hydrolase family 3 protein [Candidatus Saccharimonadales bacterium]
MLDRGGGKWVTRTLRQLSTEEKIGQMLMIWAPIRFMNVESPDYLSLRDAIRKYHIGGFGLTAMNEGPFLLKNQPLEAAALTNQLQHESPYPLIIAGDFERGLSMRIDGTTVFPHAMTFGAAGDRDSAYQFGKITAREARSIGVHWNWFPVADVNSNPENPIINTRSFSEDPEKVSELVSAYIAGAHSGGMLTTVKHFPGHGDTNTDTHLTLARVGGDRQRLNRVELVPFKSAIEAGVDAVMVAHLTVPAIEPDVKRPASISAAVVTGLLKEELGFRGLVVTDGMAMGALTQFFTGTDSEISAKSAVEAVKAGDDMVIVPLDIEGAYNGLLDAVRNGEISQARIDESVTKILRMKASLGLNRKRYVDLSAVTREIARPENVALAQGIADRGVTLIRDNHEILPIKSTTAPLKTSASFQSHPDETDASTVLVVFSDDTRSTEGGRMFVKQFRSRMPNVKVFSVDEKSSNTQKSELISRVENATRVVVVAEAFPSGGRTVRKNGKEIGSAGLDEESGSLLAKIVSIGKSKTAVVAFGNPYIVTAIPEVQTYLCTFSNTTASAISAVRALFGEIAVQGRMPVAIPGIVERGFGVQNTAKAATTVKN